MRYEASSTKVCAKAAERGAVDAQFALGLRYSTGIGGTGVDVVQAHKWLNLAAHRGNREAKRLRAELADEMTPDQVAKAQRLAREWLTTH